MLAPAKFNKLYIRFPAESLPYRFNRNAIIKMTTPMDAIISDSLI